MSDTYRVSVNGVHFHATPVDPGYQQDGEVEAMYRLEPVGTVPSVHPAASKPYLCKWGPNYTFHEGQELYGIGSESVTVEWID